MDRLGDKAQAKAEMREAGVPLVPGSADAGSVAELRAASDEIGFPVLLKATAGGGGKGMRLVTDVETFEASYQAASTEAEAAFGDGSLYVEKAVSPARHVEIQVICDTLGNVLTLGERECSVQRRHQKLIEESPSPALTPETREEMEAAVERACRAVGYVNAGTFEFILGDEGQPYFIEVNCRLQVEHPVTELVTGIDLVREQLRVAAGEALSHVGRAPRRGHAIEIRVNAEDPAHGFRPAPGLIERFRVPLGPGVRVDTAISDGVSVPPFYDSMIAKLIVHDDDRAAAIARAIRCLEELEVVGIPTTRDLAIDVLRSEGFASGNYSTGYLEEMASSFPSLRPGTRVTAGTGRRQARRQALFLLFQWDLTGQPLQSLFEGTPDPFAAALAEAVSQRVEELDARITEASSDWPADRLGTLERNIMRIGVYELEEGSVPAEVAINEAVVLAKRYATDEAARLVNGILGAIQREVTA